MNSEIYKTILFANLWRNGSKLIGRNFIMQQENDPKHIDKKMNTRKVPYIISAFISWYLHQDVLNYLEHNTFGFTGFLPRVLKKS